MKKLCLLFFAIIFAIPVFSQLEKGTVYLKNGTVLKGKYQYADNKLHVVSSGNLWVFDVAEIDTITGSGLHNVNRMAKLPGTSRYFYRTETGLLVGNTQNSQSAPFSLTGSVNYQVISNFSAGMGFGIEFFKESYLPLFLNLEYKLRDSYSTPYFFLKGGYQVPLEEGRAVYYDIYPPWSSVWPGPGYVYEDMKARGGILVNPGVGYQHMFSPGFGMSVAFGYQFHRLRYKGDKDYNLDIDYNRLSVKIGILFN